MRNKVLITGADGFIGSHLVETLVRSGYPVRAFVQYNSFNSWGWLDYCDSDVRGNFEVFSGDIRDPFGVKNAMTDCISVVHLASLIGIPYSYNSPKSYIDTNVNGTLNVLQAAREKNIERVIHTSTSEVYGSAQSVPIEETHALQGQSPYSASKIAADQLAYSFFASFDLPVVTVRPFNTYGPRQSARAIIPTVITQLASGDTRLRLGSMNPTRDFSFVSDTAEGFKSVLDSDAGLGEVVNLGTGFEISIANTVKTIAEIMTANIEIISDGERVRPMNSEVQRLCADNAKVKRLFGWSPKFADLDGFKKGLEKTIDWFVQPKNLASYKADHYNL